MFLIIYINSIMVTYSTMNYSANSYKFRLVCKYMVYVLVSAVVPVASLMKCERPYLCVIFFMCFVSLFD